MDAPSLQEFFMVAYKVEPGVPSGWYQARHLGP